MRLAVKRAGCARICRGRRAGKHVQARRNDVAYSETSDWQIPVVLTSRRRRRVNSSVHVARRDVVLRRIATTATDNVTRSTQSASHNRPSVDYRPSLYVINAAALTKPHAVEQLSVDLNSYNVDIAAVTETHLKTKHTDSIVSIPGYSLFRRDRLRRKGGGVALYVRASHSFQYHSGRSLVTTERMNYYGQTLVVCLLAYYITNLGLSLIHI